MTDRAGARARLIPAASGLLAACLLSLAWFLPLWSMTLRAPSYPQGLHLQAYGTGITGDLYEINIINHYIGMQPIAVPELEMFVFPIALGGLVLLSLLAPLHRRLHLLAIAGTAAMPLGILVDLQWWLYRFGQNLDPTAPLRQEPFTPLVIGVSRIGTFATTATVSTGFLCLAGACAVLVAGLVLSRRRTVRLIARPAVARAVRAAGGAGVLLLAWGAAPALANHALAARIAAAAPGATVVVDGGTHQGPVVIRGPLTVRGVNGPVIDGGGAGSVVTIAGTGVTFTGFVVRNSGRQVTEEAAGIKVQGDGHRIEDNVVEDVYFGIHVADARDVRVQGNRIAPGLARGARPGHGISLWHVRGGRIAGNRVTDARDGIYVSFSQDVSVAANEISGCRYGLHSMNSRNAAFSQNIVRDNLLGASLMYSDHLVMRGNRIENHRQGQAAQGLLLKDVGSLLLEGNRLVANRIGIYADSVATSGGEALVRGNIIAGNDVAFALQSTVHLTVYGNTILDNLADARAEGGRPSGSRWSRDGRGNFWSQYRGYDADRDGIGDLPYRVEGLMDELLQRNPLARAFLYTPAHVALEAAARMFPLFRPAPLLVDISPLMQPPAETGEGRP
jgi:nitrous oxidase accessory protein